MARFLVVHCIKEISKELEGSWKLIFKFAHIPNISISEQNSKFMKQTSPRTESILAFISDFKTRFKEIYGIVPHVFFEENDNAVPPLSMKSLVNIGNQFVNLDKYPNGLKTKTRKRDIVFVRQIIIKLARDLGHTYERIGDTLNLHHATCIYARKTVNQFLEISDAKTVLMLNVIKNAIQDKLGNAGDVQPDLRE